MNKTGVYIHIPFCEKKCPYCDFYSVVSEDALQESYTQALIGEMTLYQDVYADTIYLGGGTPSVLRKEQLCQIIDSAKAQFHFETGEITVEVNPYTCSEELLMALKRSGVNRLSMGLQSAVDEERKILGRKSDSAQIADQIRLAKAIGFNNISLDLILGVPGQTMDSLQKSLQFCIQQQVQHISAYMLKIEEGTPFFQMKNQLELPSEEDYCDYYEKTIAILEENGYHQYEISNFAREGFESRHNLKYWNCETYIGLGPSAHSYYAGKRFFHPRDINEYIKQNTIVPDGDGGSFEEYAMLRLRLNEGLKNEQVRERFGYDIPEKIIERSRKYIKEDYMRYGNNALALTKKGFLLSNTIICDILC